MKVKLCGFTEQSAVDAASNEGCDFIGLVFCQTSPRYISPDLAAQIIVPKNIAKVAVVVDPSIDLLEEIYKKCKVDYFQFHSNESVKFIEEVKKIFPKIKIIKAFKISGEQDLVEINRYEECANLFLFDSAKAGSGVKFDWNILKNLKTKKDWFLSGGINIDNIDQVMKIEGVKMIDISSGIEKSLAQKSPELIKKIMIKVRSYVNQN